MALPPACHAPLVSLQLTLTSRTVRNARWEPSPVQLRRLARRAPLARTPCPTTPRAFRRALPAPTGAQRCWRVSRVLLERTIRGERRAPTALPATPVPRARHPSPARVHRACTVTRERRPARLALPGISARERAAAPCVPWGSTAPRQRRRVVPAPQALTVTRRD